MDRRIKRVPAVMLLFLILFLAGAISWEIYQYHLGKKIYKDAEELFVREIGDAEESGDGTAIGDAAVKEENSGMSDKEKRKQPPITVDFETLQAVNKEAAGWLYCEGTAINYPIMQGQDNSFYLSHAYDGAESSAGALFLDAANQGDFSDSNSIIYGHHMKNGTMFSSLAKWKEQSYYEEHPVLWLLTPEQDYRVVLFSGYTTSADSDSYLLFPEPCEEFEEYLKACIDASDFHADAELPSDGRYVMLSTCEYAFQDARYVLHGLLEPVEAFSFSQTPAAWRSASACLPWRCSPIRCSASGRRACRAGQSLRLRHWPQSRGFRQVYISVNTLCDMGAACANVLGDLACPVAMTQTVPGAKKIRYRKQRTFAEIE